MARIKYYIAHYHETHLSEILETYEHEYHAQVGDAGELAELFVDRLVEVMDRDPECGALTVAIGRCPEGKGSSPDDIRLAVVKRLQARLSGAPFIHEVFP